MKPFANLISKPHPIAKLAIAIAVQITFGMLASCSQPNQATSNTSVTTPDTATAKPNGESNTSVTSNANVPKANLYTVHTFYDKSTLWGYEILKDGKAIIRQQNIPAVPGNKGFATEEKALKAGDFVAFKMEHNIFPPSVSKQELDSLGVL